ncbi:monoamine oxidase [Crossiella equi]|uniref:Monoamine oxidase n=1 Tax=Crossiella equi TaxID=130796 RepID=A0ABS5A6U7_9PSEU|nr:FAD-dependent oxidoreductase [Crossiella equi]MBP2472310.1 monoamine oxidase [Crossiella equi]
MAPELSRRLFLGGALAAAALPTGTARASAIPDPVRHLRTSWSADPFARCSYSYLAPSPLGTDVRPMLAAPVGRLHFAGEATSAEAPATTHGALESGRRAAREVLAEGARSVVVVGSGFAGTACARALADRGVAVTVLEARDRVGGRIWTARLGELPADLGASWIHGQQHNPVTDLLNATGDRRHRFDHGNADGRDQAAFAELARYQDKLDGLPRPTEVPVATVFPDPAPTALAYAASVVYSQEYGADIEDLSAHAEQEGRAARGGDLLLPDGYDRLLAHLRGEVGIRIRAVVQSVGQRADGVRLTLTGGETVEADRVVLTVPIGVLKAGTISFDPPLPQAKRQAISTIGAGLLDKLWLEFPKRFWPADADVLDWCDPHSPGRWSWWVNGYKLFGRPILLGFNSGREARRLANAPDREVVASALDALRRR